MTENYRINHPFVPDDDDGLLQGVTYGMGAIYSWTTVKIFIYFTEKESGIIYQPYIGLITLHEENGDDETLLLGELAALMQAIHYRLAQDEYKHISLFPVRYHLLLYPFLYTSLRSSIGTC